jgi:hypothetical protein
MHSRPSGGLASFPTDATRATPLSTSVAPHDRAAGFPGGHHRCCFPCEGALFPAAGRLLDRATSASRAASSVHTCFAALPATLLASARRLLSRNAATRSAPRHRGANAVAGAWAPRRPRQRKPGAEPPAATPASTPQASPRPQASRAARAPASPSATRTAPGKTTAAVLAALAGGEAMTAADVAAKADLGRPTVSTTLTKLPRPARCKQPSGVTDSRAPHHFPAGSRTPSA